MKNWLDFGIICSAIISHLFRSFSIYHQVQLINGKNSWNIFFLFLQIVLAIILPLGRPWWSSTSRWRYSGTSCSGWGVAGTARSWGRGSGRSGWTPCRQGEKLGSLGLEEISPFIPMLLVLMSIKNLKQNSTSALRRSSRQITPYCLI